MTLAVKPFYTILILLNFIALLACEKDEEGGKANALDPLTGEYLAEYRIRGSYSSGGQLIRYDSIVSLDKLSVSQPHTDLLDIKGYLDGFPLFDFKHIELSENLMYFDTALVYGISRIEFYGDSLYMRYQKNPRSSRDYNNEVYAIKMN